MANKLRSRIRKIGGHAQAMAELLDDAVVNFRNNTSGSNWLLLSANMLRYQEVVGDILEGTAIDSISDIGYYLSMATEMAESIHNEQ